MVARSPKTAFDGDKRRGGGLVFQVAQVEEDLVDRLSGPEHLVHGPDAVWIGDLVVDDAVSL